MKIFGFTYVDGHAELLLKGDSALLVNRKPYFFQDDNSRVAAHPCLVLKISRLGKNIAPRFARRYVDAYAAGLHIEDIDELAAARAAGRPWTIAAAADGSLPVGNMLPLPEDAMPAKLVFKCGNEEKVLDSPLMSIESAIAEVSKHITIRQGDLLFLTSATLTPFVPKEEEYITGSVAKEENIYCKFK